MREQEAEEIGDQDDTDSENAEYDDDHVSGVLGAGGAEFAPAEEYGDWLDELIECGLEAGGLSSVAIRSLVRQVC